jgi:peroxiredoxin
MPKTGKIINILITIIISIAIVMFASCRKKAPDNNSAAEPQSQPAPEIRQNTIEPEPSVSPENQASSTNEPAIERAKKIQQVISSATTWRPVYAHKFGTAAPDFSLSDLNGKQHRLSDYKGKTTLLLFWATWCPPCRAEIPDLIKLRERFNEEQLAILAASDEEPSKLKAFVKQTGINYTVLLDDGKMSLPFGVQRAYRSVGVPCSFIVDSAGNFVIAMAGAVPMSDILALLDAIK